MRSAGGAQGAAEFVLRNIAIAAVVFSDTSERRVYRRWVGYFNMWVAVSLIPAVLIVSFKTGAFVLRGLLAFWVPIWSTGSGPS